MTYRTVWIGNIPAAQQVEKTLAECDEGGYDLVAVNKTGLYIFKKREGSDYARLIRIVLEAATACRIVESEGEDQYSLSAIADNLEAAARAVTGG
jgi:hypothetical protein